MFANKDVVVYGTQGVCEIVGIDQRKKTANTTNAVSGTLYLGFYIVVMAVSVFFEVVVINFRPVLIDGGLEASYPSSITMLAMCVMPTAALRLRDRIQNKGCRRWVCWTIMAFTAFMVIGRFLFGVHWFTDIIGGSLFSADLVLSYYGLCKKSR